jgi:hypothetical protein
MQALFSILLRAAIMLLLLTSNLMRYVLEVLIPFRADRNVAGSPSPPNTPPPPPSAQTHQM